MIRAHSTAESEREARAGCIGSTGGVKVTPNGRWKPSKPQSSLNSKTLQNLQLGLPQTPRACSVKVLEHGT